jgi:hypothetical protein
MSNQPVAADRRPTRWFQVLRPAGAAAAELFRYGSAICSSVHSAESCRPEKKGHTRGEMGRLLPVGGQGYRLDPRQDRERDSSCIPGSDMAHCDAARVNRNNRVLFHGAPLRRMMPNGCMGSPVLVLLRS